MTTDILKIYVKRNALYRDTALNFLGATILGSVLWYYFNPKNISIHSELSLFLAVPLISLGGLILICWFGICFQNAFKCIFELLSAPKLVYSISNIGFVDHRTKRQFEWQEFNSLNISASNGDIIFQLPEKRSKVVILKRGLASDDYYKIVERIPTLIG